MGEVAAGAGVGDTCAAGTIGNYSSNLVGELPSFIGEVGFIDGEPWGLTFCSTLIVYATTALSGINFYDTGLADSCLSGSTPIASSGSLIALLSCWGTSSSSMRMISYDCLWALGLRFPIALRKIFSRYRRICMCFFLFTSKMCKSSNTLIQKVLYACRAYSSRVESLEVTLSCLLVLSSSSFLSGSLFM